MGEKDHTGGEWPPPGLEDFEERWQETLRRIDTRLTLREACDVQRLVNIAEQGRAKGPGS
jgi:hypothetical protein